MTVKALFSGDIRGVKAWFLLIDRIIELLNKQHFDVLIIVGELTIECGESSDEDKVSVSNYQF